MVALGILSSASFWRGNQVGGLPRRLTWLKLGDFLELGKTGARSYLAEDSRREYYLQSKSSPLQVMCIILRKSPWQPLSADLAG